MKLETLRCYDNGGKTFDRFTIIPPRWARGWRRLTSDSVLWQAVASSAHPFSPDGLGLHTEALPGPHLGKRVPFADLPVDVQIFAQRAFDAL